MIDTGGGGFSGSSAASSGLTNNETNTFSLGNLTFGKKSDWKMPAAIVTAALVVGYMLKNNSKGK